MTELTKDLAVAQTIALITSYSFDLQGYTIADLIPLWLDNYHASWVRLATIEALYLGRYKVVSIEQILQVWSRLGSPNTHFTHEFERLICRKLPRHLVNQSESSGENLSQANERTLEPQTSTSTRAAAAPSTRDRSYSNMPKQVADINSQKPNLPLENSERTREAAPSPTSASTPLQEQAIAEEEDQFELGNRADDSHATAYHTPIHRFTPLPDVSPLFYKLKAVAQQKLEEE
ncbi:hypothetical protein IQ238_06000 [Pleurocapsales cyanobacterium LEGE 06147]|nr:hypothetical protein [Pleurocapsales cyanobacterium LEGE 06147]